MQIHAGQFLVQPLQQNQPLAHRLLRSVLVECPLKKQGVQCNWEGDYADLQAHLLSSTAHASSGSGDKAAQPSAKNDQPTPMDVEETQHGHRCQQALTLATSLKQQANGQFESQHYKEAHSLYSKAVSVLEESLDKQENNNQPSLSEHRSLLATLYSNRAATYLQVGEYEACVADCETVYLRLDPLNSKVYVRAARAEVQRGRLRQAQAIVQQGLVASTNNATLKKEERKVVELLREEHKGQQELAAQHYGAAKSTFGKLLQSAPSALPFLLGTAQADLGLGLTDSALRMTKRILTKHPQSPMTCWVRGRTLFLMGEADTGLKLMQEALRLDPDSKEIKVSYKSTRKVKAWMEEAKKKMFHRGFTETAELLSNCIDEYKCLPPKSPLFATLHKDRAEAYFRSKEYQNALKDCAVVLYAQDDNIPTWLIKFKVFHRLGEHDTAMEEIKHLLQRFEQHPALVKAYQNADFLIRKLRRVDYYELLRVSAIASTMEIKKAYKKRSLDFHPDRQPIDATEEQRKKAQQNFQLLGEGLEIL
ncbi:MAG: hypothetical protein SGILL_007358, partial [Bacillariaceae sp.]